MKYFGVALPQDLSQLKSINYDPLISQIKSDTGKWNLVMFTSLDSRIKVIKMNVLPRLLHLLQTLPAEVTNKDFIEWDILNASCHQKTRTKTNSECCMLQQKRYDVYP